MSRIRNSSLVAAPGYEQRKRELRLLASSADGFGSLLVHWHELQGDPHLVAFDKRPASGITSQSLVAEILKLEFPNDDD
jgi:hypothetical protein